MKGGSLFSLTGTFAKLLNKRAQVLINSEWSVTSALLRITDSTRTSRHVRFVPKNRSRPSPHRDERRELIDDGLNEAPATSGESRWLGLPRDIQNSPYFLARSDFVA